MPGKSRVTFGELVAESRRHRNCAEQISQPLTLESKHNMNITDLLKLKHDHLLPLIRQVADRVRNSRTPQKYRRLREKLLEACDIVGREQGGEHGH